MVLLSRDDILGADDRATTDVNCPEWGGTVRLRALSGEERDAWENSVVQIQGNSQRVDARNVRAKLVARCAVDADGQRLFTEKDIKALGAKNSAPLDRLFEAAQKLSGLSDQDVNELAGNSEGGRNDASTSD